MRISAVWLLGILACMLATPLLAGPPANAENREKAESIRKAIAETKDEREQALLYKQLGDLYASREEYGEASDEFLRALALAPAAFTEQERLRMAITISWANRAAEAAAVLRSILGEDPGNRDARIHLAKVLSWAGELKAADAEADRILRDDPDNQEALLVKANVLRWQGDAAGSVPLYEKILRQAEQFDARLGLTYAYITLGDRKGAEENAGLLKPQYPYQDKELKELDDALCGVKTSRPAIRYSYYHDSDHNIVNRYGLAYGFRLGTGEAGISYRVAEAKDLTRSITARDVFVTASGRWGTTGAGAALGVSRPDSGSRAVGSVRLDKQVGWGTLGISLSRELMTETAQLIENRIVRSAGSLVLTQTITQRTSFSEGYAHTSYSDSNHADDVQLGVRQAITLSSPRVATGYRFRYWNFERQSNGGYFDPNHFISHQIFVALSGERGGWHAGLEPYVGIQSFTRDGEYRSQGFYGVGASAGWSMKKCTSFDINGEGGNYAGGTAAGFSYYLVGFSLKAYF